MKISKIQLAGQQVKELIDKDLSSNYADNSTDDFDLKEKYVVQSPLRSGENEHVIDVKKGEVYELDFEDDTFWIGDADALSELTPFTAFRGDNETFILPKEIVVYDEQRSLSKKILVKFFKIFRKNTTAAITDAAILATAKKFEDRLHKEENKLGDKSGRLFRCKDDMQFLDVDFSDLNKPYLLLIHGTGSSTKWCFEDWINSPEWLQIWNLYGPNHIIALENRSFTCSPLLNVLDLIKALPSGIELDILCHSRGGIIADILARYTTHQKGWDEFERRKFKENNRGNDEALLLEIENEISEKNIRIRKIVRVGVPAAGTTILTKRLDIFFNIITNLLNIIPVINAGAPVFNALKNLLLMVAERRSNPDVLPGLEAMIPDSPLVKMINTPGTDILINSPLYVISGDRKLDLKPKAVLTLISKVFFMGANDYVVDTKSMDQGAARGDNLTFIYHQHSSDLSHIGYFKIDSVRQRIVSALGSVDGEIPQFFNPKRHRVAGERNALLGIDGGKVMRINISGQKPIVLILPGIMGSNLEIQQTIGGKKKNQLLWINYMRFLQGDLTKLEYLANNSNGIQPHSLVATSYKDMANYFNNNYDVVTLPFDWRIPIKDSAEFLNLKIQELMAYEMPIHVIAHSMGGVLLRNWMIQFPESFEKLNLRPGFKAVFLGAPLEGSYRILYVLFGRDGIIRKLARIDRKNSMQELVTVFLTMPGLLNLLPIQSNGNAIDFSNIKEWRKIRDKFGNKDWPIPDENVLTEFGKLQKEILAGRKKIIWDNLYYIAGLSRRKNPTISDIDLTGNELKFIATSSGDESVTWESGIPKELIAAGRVYYADTTHGGLSTKRVVFKALEQIFLDHREVSISQNPPQTRGQERIEERDIPFPEELFDLSEESLEYDLLNVVRDDEPIEIHFPLKVWVSNGDLKYANFPVLAGHFKFDGILTSELAIDKQLNGELRKLLQLNLYPGDIGSNIVVLNDGGKTYGSQFKGTVIIGLGVPGELSGYQLMKSVEQGVARYLMVFNGSEACNDNETVQKIGITCIALANTYGGLSTMTSVRSIISGINRGNQKIAALFPNHARLVEEVEFIDVYHDTAINIHKCLTQLEQTVGGTENFDLIRRKIKPKSGRLYRIPMENSRDWWTRITVNIEKVAGKNQEIGGEYLKVAMSTTGASERVAEVYGDFGTFRSMVDEIGKNHRYSPELAKTLFERLIPAEFKEDIKRQNNIVWVLDKDAASFPWEMIQEDILAEPLCVNAGMVRQLSTADVRVNGNLVSNRRVLVIGDPELENSYSQLPGAKKEAEDLTKTFEGNGFETVSLINNSFYDILIHLYSKEYKILHLAGHGVFDPKNGITSGMLIGNKKFLSPADIKQMSAIPELVFVNCCYLGASDAKAEELSQNRNKLAANIGTQLIEIGVKAVIVAGWAIDDITAHDFAMDFYQEMFMGCTFGDAIKQARKKIHKNSRQSNNSWGAYQCYGDPFFRLTDPSSSLRSTGIKFSCKEEAEIELENMLNKVDSGEYIPDEVLAKLSEVIQVIENQNLKSDKSLELSARLFARLGKYEEAVARFTDVLKLPKAEYAVKSLEEYCNILTKFIVRQHLQMLGTLTPEEDANKLREAIQKSVKDKLKSIDQVIAHLSHLSIFSETRERYALMGSAYKRKMMLYDSTSINEIVDCLEKAVEYYEKAYEIKKDPYYVNNILPLRHILNWLKPGANSPDTNKITNEKYLEFLSEKLEKIDDHNPQEMDYWDLAFQVNTLQTFYLMNLSGAQKVEIKQVYEAYSHLWNWTGNHFNKIAEIENLEILIRPLELIVEKVKGSSKKAKNSKNTTHPAEIALSDLKELKNKLEKDIKL